MSTEDEWHATEHGDVSVRAHVASNDDLRITTYSYVVAGGHQPAPSAEDVLRANYSLGVGKLLTAPNGDVTYQIEVAESALTPAALAEVGTRTALLGNYYRGHFSGGSTR